MLKAKRIYSSYDLQEEISKRLGKKIEFISMICDWSEVSGNGCVTYLNPAERLIDNKIENEDERDWEKLTPEEEEVMIILDQICKENKIKDCMRIEVSW